MTLGLEAQNTICRVTEKGFIVGMRLDRTETLSLKRVAKRLSRQQPIG